MASTKGLESRQLDEVMTRQVEYVRPADTIVEASEKMRALNVGALPVCDGNRLQGMLTDRDIVLRAIAEHRDPSSMRVHEAMSPGVVYCYEDQRAEDAAHIMRERQIRRLPVLNRENQLVGIVSLGDLAVKTKETTATAEALEKISEPARPVRKAV
jgi:CBS domain-containing protein